MKKILEYIFIIAFVVLLSENVQTVIKNEVNGENASVHTEITNNVNGTVTKVESDKPGEIRVETKDGKTQVSTNQKPDLSITTSIKKAKATVTPSAKSVLPKSNTDSFIKRMLLKITNLLHFSFLTKL